jgi:Tc toxin complex TcA C-terminal TcB-binding domain
MEDAAWRRGMLSRGLELDNIDRNIAELQQNKVLAASQQAAAAARVDVTEQQLKIAELQQQHAEELLNSFESQMFTPEVWFQLGSHIKAISAADLAQAIGAAKKMQFAYELETGFKLTTIKSSYTTNIVSGLLSADYVLRDINYFTIHRINNTMSKDIPIKQELSLASLGPIAFETTFKASDRLEFETNAADFDRAYPGAYLRKIKKVEVVVEGLLPPGGVHGTLKNSGISRDRKRDGTQFFRVQPKETLFLSQYNPRSDIAIFQPDQRVLDVFEHCGSTARVWCSASTSRTSPTALTSRWPISNRPTRSPSITTTPAAAARGARAGTASGTRRDMGGESSPRPWPARTVPSGSTLRTASWPWPSRAATSRATLSTHSATAAPCR